MALDIKKFIVRFIEEAKDHLGRLASGLAELEQGFDAEQINSLFRSAHTLKGSSRMLKLEPITQVAHSLEDLLSALRDQRLSINPQVNGLLYQGVDLLTDQVEALADNGQVTPLTAQQLEFCQHLSQVAETPALLDATANTFSYLSCYACCCKCSDRTRTASRKNDRKSFRASKQARFKNLRHSAY